MTPHPATIVLRLAALIFLVASCYPARFAADAPAAPPVVTVSQPIQRELVEWDEFTGQFAAKEYVEIRARVSGYLNEIHFQDGQIVKEGASAVRDRPAALRGGARRGARRSSPRPTPRSTLRPSSSTAPRAPQAGFRPASNYDERVPDQGRDGRSRSRQGRDPLGRARRGVHPDHRAVHRPHQQAPGQHRQPDRRQRQRHDPR